MKTTQLFFFLVFLTLPSAILHAQNLSDTTETQNTFGTINFSLNVDSALIIINNQFDEARFIKNESSIKVKTGIVSVKLSVLHDYLFEQVLTVQKDTVITVSHEFEKLTLTKDVLNGNYAARRHFDANLLIISDEESEISLNDNVIGKEYVFLDSPVGDNIVSVKSPKEGTSLFFFNTRKFTNSDYSLRVIQNYIKPDKDLSRMLAFLPGFSQAYKYENVKASVIRVSMISSALALSSLEVKYRIDKKKFDSDLKEYRETLNTSLATTLGNDLDDQSSSLDRLALFRNISLATLISVYTYNVLDGIFHKPKVGYLEKKPIQFYLSSGQLSRIDATFKVSF